MIHVRDTMSTSGDVQYIGRYHEYIGGYHKSVGGYHEYIEDVQYIHSFISFNHFYPR